MTSSAWQISPSLPKDWRSFAALENLHLNASVLAPSSTDLPPKSALVRIRAAAINARDVMVIAHDPIYPIPNKKDLTPCADGAGEITAVGSDSVFKIGDRVMIHPAGWIDEEELPNLVEMKGKGAGSIDGTLRQFGVFEENNLILAPPSLSFFQIAAIPACGGTAINALFYGPQPLKPGMTILTQGTGGVSSFCIQIASLFGCTVISTSSSDAKIAIARSLGATHTINYTTFPEWDVEVLRLTGGRGVDHVLEVGGGGTIERSLRCVKQGGLVSLIGFLAGGKESDITPALLFGGKTLRGVFGFNRGHEEALVKFVEEYGLKPEIAQVFEWEEAKEAFEKSMARELVGKIVIKV
ncbi:putative alcohol dehydrogenase [Leptodontidium sp. MPI-SDFR-AT-0119]|nr:putative alcohol dehydrogenase [Leptodontidium sp. MPI-SDFR-AT-0119]